MIAVGCAWRLLGEMNGSDTSGSPLARAGAGVDEGLDWLFCAEAWLDIVDADAGERLPGTSIVVFAGRGKRPRWPWS